jgi:CSLREA domain-containing protein
LLFAYTSSPAWASTITVNSPADDADPNDGECTLREAITAANTDTSSGMAAGECAAGSGDDGIDIGLTGTVNLTGALPNLSSNLAIAGPGADEFTVRRDSGGDYRIFTVTSGSVVSISGITITNGETPEGFDGGGIYNAGTLTVTDSTISGNSATVSVGVLGGDDGGGIYNAGTLTVTGSTITNNTAGTDSGGFINGDGGGIDNHGTFTVTDSTITNNTAGDAGGGIFCNTNLPGVTTTITNSTISGNTAGPFGGGGVFNFEGYTLIEFSTITNNTASTALARGSGVASLGDENSLTTEVVSSIIFANTNTDVDFVSGQTNSFVSSGYNLIGDGNAIWDFNQTGDQIDHFGVTNPGLGALADNGGPTQTHALLSGSPAIDAVPQGTNKCGTDITQDQRGVSRPQGSNCDIGSFELEKPDTEAPKVISTFPPVAGEGGPAANIRATFSEDMRVNTINGATFKLFRKGSTSQIGAAVTYDATTHIATLNPTNNLRRGVTYKAVVSTLAKDVAGNRLDQNPSLDGLQKKVWFFEIDN